MKSIKHIITKAHKSATLFFNWTVTVLAVGVEVAMQNIPALKEAVTPEYYLLALILVTTANKLLRVKTDKPLEAK